MLGSQEEGYAVLQFHHMDGRLICGGGGSPYESFFPEAGIPSMSVPCWSFWQPDAAAAAGQDRGAVESKSKVACTNLVPGSDSSREACRTCVPVCYGFRTAPTGVRPCCRDTPVHVQPRTNMFISWVAFLLERCDVEPTSVRGS